MLFRSGMRELGDLAHDQHRAIGELAVELGIDHIICVGEAARETPGTDLVMALTG